MSALTQPRHTPKLDGATICHDFPIFNREVHGKPLTFLDSAASAQKPQCVIDAVAECYSYSYANIHRGLYSLSQEATTAYEAARAKIASFINAPENSIVFTRGATESINLIAATWGRMHLKAGDEIVVTTLEHHANIVPWQLLGEQVGCNLKVVPVQDNGEVTLADFNAALSDKTKLVAVTHMSNSIGSVLPVKAMIDAAHSKNIPVLVDGCQAAPRMAVDVAALDADFYVFSGHKMYGPTGIGVLYAKPEILKTMPPYQSGGDMIENVTFEKTTFAEPPARFEAGTPHIAGAIGLGAAVDYLTSLGMGAIEDHEAALLHAATEALQRIEGLTIIGTTATKGPIISFIMDGLHPHDIGTLLDQQGICVRTGHHCAQPAMARFGIDATTRVSFGIYNTFEDVERLINGLEKVKKICG